MKKVLLSLLFAVCFLTGTAQKFRYQGEINVSIGGEFRNKEFSYGIQTIHGVRFRSLMVGAGIGVEDLHRIPLFGHVKYYFSSRKIAPYVSIDAGYAISPTSGGGSTGTYLSPALGMNIQLGNRLGVLVGLMYQAQEGFPAFEPWRESRGPYWQHALRFKAAFTW